MAIFGLGTTEITMCYSVAIGGQVTGKQARVILEEVVEKESEEQSLGASKYPG